MKFPSQICHDLDAALSREWLLPNYLGGWASSTICGCNTRRYHGLLVANLAPSANGLPSGRFVFLNKIDEVIGSDDERWELATNRYSETIHPQGFQCIDEVEVTHLVRARFALPWGALFKTIEVPAGKNAG